MAFESQLSDCHSTIWKFIEGIQRAQSLTEMKIVQIQSGLPATPRKKKYQALDERIKNVLDTFNNNDPVGFLGNLAVNIAL